MSRKVLLESANGLYKHKITKQINVVAKIIALPCDISLQFDCNFINTYKAYISILRKTTSLIKIPMNLLAILSTIFQLQEQIKDYNEYNRTKKNKLTHNELKAQILSKALILVIYILEILIALKIPELLLGKKAHVVKLLPHILYITIPQPISEYFACTEYSNTRDSSKFRKCGFETATLVFSILSFVLQNVVKTQDRPMVLGPNLIYTLNYGVLATMTCTTLSIFSTLDVLYFTEQSLDSPFYEMDEPYKESLNDNSPDIP